MSREEVRPRRSVDDRREPRTPLDATFRVAFAVLIAAALGALVLLLTGVIGPGADGGEHDERNVPVYPPEHSSR